MSLAASDFEFVRTLVKQKAAIALENGKEYLVESRLTPLLKETGIATISELIQNIKDKKNAQLVDKVVDVMTTNETFFFRDINPFEALKKTVIPNLLAKRGPSEPIRIWCAASSTGQEPYTIAMTIAANFDAQKHRFSIAASDISPTVLAKAKSGTYSQIEVNRGLPAPLLVKYFTKQGTDWQIKDDIKKMVTYSLINLSLPLPSMQPLDIVFIRNVLIYFDLDTKKQILGGIRKLLKPDGYLFLGGSESTLNIDENFERQSSENSTYYTLKK